MKNSLWWTKKILGCYVREIKLSGLLPAPWLELGVSRGALVGGRFDGGSVPWDPKPYGPDQGSLSLKDILKVFLGQLTPFDDQITAFDVRGSLAGLGLPALAYGELGLEDKDRSWGDPAVMAGLLVAPSSAPVGIRYEYAAFGRPARWCPWCDTLPAFWYQHTRFQSGWQVGDQLLGHPLGGYGLQHLVEVSFFDRSYGVSGDVGGGWLRRDRWNLLEDGRPGRAAFALAALRVRPRPYLELRGSGRVEKGREGWSAGELNVGVRYLF